MCNTETKYKIQVNNDFVPLAKELIELKESFQIQAMAGCGKTYLLKEIMKQLNEQEKKYMCLAPTHKACRGMAEDASTLHTFCNVASCSKGILFDYIIIDEKSMMLEYFYNVLYKLKKKNPNCKFIVCGDWGQLPPVGDRKNCDYVNSYAFNDLVDFNYVQLSKCRRSDKELFDMYSDPENIDMGKVGKEHHMRNICYLNSTRKRINKICMDLMAPNNHFVIPRNKSNDQSQDMKVYQGLPVIACRTKKVINPFEKDGFVNSDEGEVVYCDDEVVHIMIEGMKDVIELSHSDFAVSFYPAYCITVHKSQGITIDEPYTIHDWGKMNTTMKYVAMSRSTKASYLNLIN